MSGLDREVARLFVQLEAEVSGLRRGLREGDRAWAAHVADVKKHLDRIAALEEEHNRTREISKKNSLARQINDEKTALVKMHSDATRALDAREQAERAAAAERKRIVKDELAFKKACWDADVARRKQQMGEEARHSKALAREKAAAERMAAKEAAESARTQAKAQRDAARATENYVRQSERAQERLKQKLISVERAAITWARRGAVIAATATGIIGLRAVKTAGQFEQTEVAFEQMLGSGVKAKKFLDKLKEFAATTPFEFSELTDQAKRLMAVGFSAQEVLPTLTKVGDAVSSLGLDNSRLNRIILALSQMRNAASISAQDMRQLTEAGIPVWDMLTKGLNDRGIKATKQDVVDPYWRKDQKLSGQDGFNIILEQMGKRYKGMMQKQSKTLLGLWSNFKDRLTYLMIDVGNMIIDRFDLKDKLAKMVEGMRTGELQAKIMGVVDDVVDLTEKVINLGTWLWKHKDTIIQVAEAYAVLHVQLRAMMFLGAITGAMRAYTTAAAAGAVANSVLSASMGAGMVGNMGKVTKGAGAMRGAMMAIPFGPWGIAALAAGTGAYYLWKHIKSGSDAYKTITPEAKRAAETIQKQRDAAKNAQDANQKLKDANKAVADAAEKAGKKSDAYKDALRRQEQAAKDAKKANDDLKNSQDTDKDGESGTSTDKSYDTINFATANSDLARLIEERKKKFRELREWMIEYNAPRNYQAQTGAQLGLQGMGRALELPGGNGMGFEKRLEQLQKFREEMAKLYQDNANLQDPAQAKELVDNIAAIDDMIQRLKDGRESLGGKIEGRWTELDENRAALEELYKMLGLKSPWEEQKKNVFDTMNFMGMQVIKTTPVVKREIQKMLSAEGLPSMSSAGVVKKMLEAMTAAEREAKFGTDNVNKILARAGLTKPNPQFNKEFAESNRRAVEDARKKKEEANAQLAAIGKVKAQTSEWGASLVRGIQGAINTAKDWAGKNPVKIGINALLNLAGIGGDDSFGGNGSTKGLKPQMMMPLQLGNRMGLSMSSGYRPGAVTKNGKRSDHATGNAIDMVGTTTEMAAYYRLASVLPGAKQVIYSPLDGWSNDHYDHVHVAMRRHGGFIPGSSHQDTVPAMLTKGEYVFTREAVQNAGGPNAMDYFHNRLKGGVNRFRSGGSVGKKSRKKVGNVKGPSKPVKPANSQGYIDGAKLEADPSEAALIAKRNYQQKILNGLQDDENRASARVNKEKRDFDIVKSKHKPGTKEYKQASKQYKDALKDLKKIKERRKNAAAEIVSLNRDIISERQERESERQDALNATIEQETGKRNFEYKNSLEASDLNLSNLSVKEADAKRTAGMEDDAAVSAEIKAAWMKREADVRKYLGRSDLTSEERISANSELTSIMSNLESGSENDSVSQLQAAQNEQLQRRMEIAEENARISEAGIRALSSAGDMGYAGGVNAYQAAAGAKPVVVNINALSGYDPGVQRAVARATNGGFSSGGTNDQLYSGRA